MANAIVVPGHGAVDRDGVYRITPRCRRLVAEAALTAEREPPSVVVFTGWSPVGGPSEAEQMREAWPGPPLELVSEPSASCTVENATRTLPLLRARGVERALVVCAPLHLLRTRYFFRRIYGPEGIETAFQVARMAPSVDALVWELLALPLRGAQLRAARAEAARRQPGP